MTLIAIDNYIYNSITQDDVIENEIDQELLERSEDHDCGYEVGNGEEGCNSPTHNNE